MKVKFLFFLIFFITVKSFGQQNCYEFWYIKMKTNVHLVEVFKLSEEARIKIQDGYYGNDIQLVKKVDPNCYKSEAQLTDCLKSVGFKKAAIFSNGIFERIKLFSMFIKENPNFYKLDLELRKKLLKKFALDNFITQYPI
jgi:hypothetical protein